MPSRLRLVLVLACAVALLSASTAAATSSSSPVRPSPISSALRAEVINAGAQGVKVGDEQLNLDCPGFATTGVAAAGCIVAPYGCTVNADGSTTGAAATSCG